MNSSELMNVVEAISFCAGFVKHTFTNSSYVNTRVKEKNMFETNLAHELRFMIHSPMVYQHCRGRVNEQLTRGVLVLDVVQPFPWVDF